MSAMVRDPGTTRSSLPRMRSSVYDDARAFVEDGVGLRTVQLWTSSKPFKVPGAQRMYIAGAFERSSCACSDVKTQYDIPDTSRGLCA